MAEQPRDFNHWVKSVERRLQQSLRNGQSPQAVRLAREVQQVRNEVDNIEAGSSPAAPIELVVQTRVLPDLTGTNQGEVSVDFPDVVVDVDANPIEVDRYELWMRNITDWDQNDETDKRPLTLYNTVEESSIAWSPVKPGHWYEVRVRAVAKGVPGPFSTSEEVQIERDTTPPPIPSGLSLTSSGATVTASWDLLAGTGDPMPGDFSNTEVAYGYNPAPTEVVGSITELFSQSIFETPQPGTDVDFDGTYYFRHRSVDTSGNRSGWSESSSIVPKQLVDTAALQFELDAVNRERIEPLEKEIANAVAEASSNIEDFETRWDAQWDNTIPALGDRQDTLEGDIATAQQQADQRYSELDSRADTAEQNISDATDRLTAAETTLAPLPGDVADAKQSASNAREAAEAAEARAIEASNAAGNRIDNGSFEMGLDHWDTSSVTITNDAHSGTQAALIADGGTLLPESSIPVSGGDVWDISLFGKATTGTLDIAVHDLDESGNAVGIVDSFTVASTGGWADPGRQRVTMPEGSNRVHFEVSAVGGDWAVDDIVLRDVTDVVRLEQAAKNAADKAETAESKADALQLTVEGEGGLRDRLDTTETTLQGKAEASELDELDDILRGDVDLSNQTANKFWANMAVVSRLQATEGYVGGVNLADGVVMAQVVEASQQVITDVLAANVGLVRDELIVQGDLLANTASILAAEMKELTVTERADFVSAWADELYADEFTARVGTVSRLTVVGMTDFAPDLANHADMWNLGNDVSVASSNIAENGLAFQIAGGASSVSGRAYGPWIPAKPGDTIRWRLKVGRYTHLPDGALRIYFLFDGSTISWSRVESVTSTGTYEGVFTVPSSVTESVAFGVNIDTSATNDGVWAVRDFDVRKQVRGVLIEPEGIKSPQVDTAELTASSAFLDNAMVNLIQGRMANFDEALIGGTLLKNDTVATRHLTVTNTEDLFPQEWMDDIHDSIYVFSPAASNLANSKFNTRFFQEDPTGVDGNVEWTTTTLQGDRGFQVWPGRNSGVNQRIAFRSGPGKGVMVRPGEQYTLRCRVRDRNDGGFFDARMALADLETGEGLPIADAPGMSVRGLVHGSDDELVWTFTIPDNFPRMWMVPSFHSGANSDSGARTVLRPQLFRAIDGKLIVDGLLQATTGILEELFFDSAVGNTIAAGAGEFITVETGNLAANAVTADKISFGSLNGSLITGLQIQTHTNNRGVKLTSSGIRAFNSSGTETFTLNASDGSITMQDPSSGSEVLRVSGGSTRFSGRFQTSTSAGRGVTIDEGTVTWTGADGDRVTSTNTPYISFERDTSSYTGGGLIGLLQNGSLIMAPGIDHSQSVRVDGSMQIASYTSIDDGALSVSLNGANAYLAGDALDLRDSGNRRRLLGPDGLYMDTSSSAQPAGIYISGPRAHLRGRLSDGITSTESFGFYQFGRFEMSSGDDFASGSATFGNPVPGGKRYPILGVRGTTASWGDFEWYSVSGYDYKSSGFDWVISRGVMSSMGFTTFYLEVIAPWN